MSIQTQADSLCAELSLIAISSLHGRVIGKGIQWQLEDSDGAQHSSIESQPVFRIQAGKYKIAANYKGREFKLGEVDLERTKRLTHVVLLQDAEEYDPDQGYFISNDDFDKVTEFLRRQQERAGIDSMHELVGGPLADPYIAEQSGNGFAAHPLLQAAMFDGLPPEMKIDPAENQTAVQKQLEHKHQHQLGAANNFNPTPTR